MTDDRSVREEMASAFFRRQLTVPTRRAQYVGYSLQMLAGLPSASEAAQSGLIRNACVDAWFVHARLLIDFFMIRGEPSARDFSAADFGWTRAQSAGHERLIALWGEASQQVVHFSDERVPEDLADLDSETFGLEYMLDYTDEILGIADEFSTFLADTGDPNASLVRNDLEAARTSRGRRGGA